LLAAVGELWTTRPQAELAPGGGWTDELRAEVERVVAGICRHHGLLIERGPQQWSFLHRGLQEYYVARSLIDQPAPAYAIRCRLHDRDYAEPVLLALGIATHVTGRPDAAEVFAAALLATGPHADTRPDLFVPADLEELIGRDRKFAVLAAADEVDIDPRTLEWLAAGQIPKDLLPGLAGTALGRRHSAHRLAQAVASGAGHDVRWACGASLAQLGEKATAAELFRSLAVDPAIDGELRRRSAVSLGQLGDTSPETFELLRSLVADQGSEADLRWRSAVSLGRLGDTSHETEELLLTLASKHGIEEDVRWSCAAALGQLGQAATSAALLRDLASDAGVDGYVRWSAVSSLGWV
jgi:hypothetical protein